jgi:hypothetical protein
MHTRGTPVLGNMTSHVMETERDDVFVVSVVVIIIIVNIVQQNFVGSMLLENVFTRFSGALPIL